MEAAAKDVLVPEARELLLDMERALLEMETEGPSEERVNAVFRAAHTIKGSAGLFGLELIVGFTQVMESVLDLVRGGKLGINESLMSLLLNAGDYIGLLVTAIEQGTEEVDPNPVTRASLMAQMTLLLPEPSTRLQRARHATKGDADAGHARPEAHYHLSLRFGQGVLRNGMDPLSFILYLRQLGSLMYVHTLAEQLPPAEALDPELCYLGFEVGLRTRAAREQIEQVFDFVRDDSTVRILPPQSQAADYIQLIRSLPSSRRRLGEMLLACGALTESELARALRKQALSLAEGHPVPLGEVLIKDQLVAGPVVASALSKQKKVEDRRSSEQRVLKVDAARLDQLINLVGELVIASEGARLRASKLQQPELVEANARVSQLVEQVRDRALNMRMIPIGDVFQRFPRVVRDVARELGKDINLVITGAEAELDKSMVDKLSDPLLHIVRNAIDHGIEPIAERCQSGKPAQGRLHLHAYHESGCIVVEIKDDGRGLDRDRIFAKAVERGLVPADAVLSQAEIHQLLFMPGFSTAAAVTDLSGRGVGMDVVKRNVEQLGGQIEIASRKGFGTRFRIRLPLTLAIIDGFQVEVSDTVFVLPLSMVVECVDMSGVREGQNLVSLRGEPLPFLRLREVLGLPRCGRARESLVVVRHGQQRIGLAVDRLLGDFQAVIKPLGQLFKGIKAVSSSTILGDGTVALVLDVPTLVARAGSQRPDATTHALTH